MANSTPSFHSKNTAPPLGEGIELRTIRGRVFKWDTIHGGPVLEEVAEAHPVASTAPGTPAPVNESVPAAPVPAVSGDSSEPGAVVDKT